MVRFLETHLHYTLDSLRDYLQNTYLIAIIYVDIFFLEDRNIMSFLSSPYMSSFVGFESLFDEIERMSSVKQSSYPAYDIKKLSSNSFLIVLALAGFTAKELIIEATSSELIVYGNGDKNGHHEYIHKGIAKRAFTKTFRLANNVVVDGAEFKDGLLSIHLYTKEPKKEVPKKISIKS